MTNHVHLVVVPTREDSLGDAIGKTHGHFTQYAHRTRGTKGHLWEDRFHSCPLDESHLLFTLNYVDRNPVRAGIVKHAWEYEWSSSQAHINGSDMWGLIDMKRWFEFLRDSMIDWRAYVDKAEEEKDLEELRKNTQSGIAFGR